MGFHLKLCVRIAVCQELISLNQHFTMILMFNWAKGETSSEKDVRARAHFDLKICFQLCEPSRGNSRMTYKCKCFKNPPLGILGDSRQIELSSSIFLLRLQFNTLLALGNILGSILYLKIQKYLLKKFPEPLKFDPTWFGTPSGHKLSVKKIWLIKYFRLRFR